MQKNEFHRTVSTETVPHGRTCEWCSGPAEQQMTVQGGTYHNQSGIFCSSCGEHFVQVVSRAQAVDVASMR
jgi:hypothetical protein